MAPQKYRDKPKPADSGTVTAARYHAGSGPENLADLLAVAQMIDSDAEIVEVPEWKLALVRTTRYPDNGGRYVDYDHVEDGGWLYYSHRIDVLVDTDDESFRRDHEV